VNRSISKLKDQARNHEQNEEWAEAIRAYQQVLKISEEGEGEVELSLLNRIGDLYLREGKGGDAVRYYELAADRYEAAGLVNSAIALCNKVIRQDANRPEPYYRLARLTLEQGFLSEARRWSVEYAEKMIRAGKRKEAFAALNEFASHAADPEIRELLAQYLLAHDATAEALTQLLEAYRARREGNQPEKAQELRDKILKLDPSIDLSAFEGSGRAGGYAGAEGHAGEEEPAPLPQLDDGFGDASMLDGAIIALPELELQTAADSAGIEVVEESTGGPGDLMLDVGVEITLDVAPTAVVEAEVEADTGPELLDLELAGADFAGDQVSQGEDAAAALADAMLLDISGISEPVAPEPAAPAPNAPAPIAPAPAAPVPAVPAPAAPKPPAAEAAPPARAPSADRASSSRSGAGGGFVDFGALLQDSSDAEQGLTRYVVDAPTPSGDEDRDFLDMLEQFKSKVSEHLGDDDAQSRYDLGLAFKEMGLYDEAISQFQMALRGLEDQLKVYEELGDCFMQKGEHTIALKILQGALAVASSSGGGELIGVYYQLGRTYEELGRAAEARDAYERVLVFDLEFRDASSRLARL
jgi:tetratricopeptide (TPR) repeat protein